MKFEKQVVLATFGLSGGQFKASLFRASLFRASLFRASLFNLSLHTILAALMILSLSILSLSATTSYAQQTAAQDAPAKDKKTNPLTTFEIVDTIKSKSIPASLTGKAGNPKRGESLMITRSKGNCLACHEVIKFEKKAEKDPNNYGDMGEIGPNLDGVAARYQPGELRLMLVDAKQFFPETIMPAFYNVKKLYRVDTGFKDKPILTAQEIEDVLSFLLTLK